MKLVLNGYFFWVMPINLHFLTLNVILFRWLQVHKLSRSSWNIIRSFGQITTLNALQSSAYSATELSWLTTSGTLGSRARSAEEKKNNSAALSNRTTVYFISGILRTDLWSQVNSGRSLLKMTKNRGPKMDPCRTPDVIFSQVEHSPSTTTLCLRFDE